jgi:hypothetical protein
MRRRRSEEAVIFIASLYSSPDIFAAAIPFLRKRFGEVFYESPCLSWDYSSYYAEEMGSPLHRSFLFFDQVLDPTALVEAKLAAGELEDVFSLNGRRQINLDPGYLTLAKVVLASSKNYSHRIYLGSGVFCELELFYEKGRFIPLPYTYFDYRDGDCLAVFSNARKLFKQKLERSHREALKVP